MPPCTSVAFFESNLATSEISVHQIKQWYNTNTEISGDEENFILNQETFEKILNEEFKEMLNNNQVPYASQHYQTAKELLKEFNFPLNEKKN